MYCDLPLLKRCCFCLPLRPGLIAWGYIKTLAVLIFTALLLILLADNLARLNHQYYRTDTSNLIIQTILLIIMIVDVGFSITFLVSAHKKNHELMQKCLHYNVFIFVVSNIIFFLFIAYVTYIVYLWQFFLGEMLIFCLAIGLINAVLQFYVILLIRSEIQKLSNDCYFRFENHAAAAQCHMTVGKLNIPIIGVQKQDKLDLIKEEVPPSVV